MSEIEDKMIKAKNIVRSSLGPLVGQVIDKKFLANLEHQIRNSLMALSKETSIIKFHIEYDGKDTINVIPENEYTAFLMRRAKPT